MPSVRIADHFAELADPRKRKVTHALVNVLTIALCVENIERFFAEHVEDNFARAKATPTPTSASSAAPP